MTNAHILRACMEPSLRKLRKARGLTTTQVAEKIGITQGQYSRIENGVRPSPETAERIAEFFGREYVTEMHLLYPDRYGRREPA